MDSKIRRFVVLLPLLGCVGLGVPAVSAPVPASWSPAAIAALQHRVAAAPEDCLPVLATTDLEQALAGKDQTAIDAAASALALKLARLHLLGKASVAERQHWGIADSDGRIDVAARLAQALASAPAGSAEGLERFFEDVKPHHPDYAALRKAFATEQDPARRATLALNMERWRWMPLSLGPDFLLVNTAAFQVSLWRQGRQVESWPVIVGKISTPTPVFSAKVTGVTFNPWWDVPANIVRESIGALARRNPALAHQRGYVWANGHYRQRPGAGNSLGQMKLAMPNPYNVYLHDTPTKALFARDVRAFSHGCIRVGNAPGFAATLLQGVKSVEETNALVASGQTSTIALAAPLPVYVTYFTATATSDGTVQILPDIYRRDANRGYGAGTACPA